MKRLIKKIGGKVRDTLIDFLVFGSYLSVIFRTRYGLIYLSSYRLKKDIQ